MALDYRSLDEQTRKHMVDELDFDVANKNVYLSNRLNDKGRGIWPDLFREAIKSQNDAWLSGQIRKNALLKSHEERRTPKGGTTTAKVPETAPDTLAEGEFNRSYARGLCARAVHEGKGQVEVYRARQSNNPRPESEALVGKKIDANALLNDLRKSVGVEPALGVPPGPNSGLSVLLPKG